MVELKDGMVVVFFHYAAGTCLDLTEGYQRNGAEVIGFNYHGAANQHWRLDKVERMDRDIWPTWNLVNVMSGTAMTMDDPNIGAPVTCWKHTRHTNDPRQMWHLVTADAESGVYMLHNVGSTLFADLRHGNTACWTSITGRKGGFNSANTNQLWRMRVISLAQGDNEMSLRGLSGGGSGGNKKRKVGPALLPSPEIVSGDTIWTANTSGVTDDMLLFQPMDMDSSS
ncbi:ricin B lectin domain-containing protein [Microdochium trichocladiopsis]|uniref:Ricin B lectin domain-containing protein n=1 Tax=Microdochium trichocladiopsis TaxID=1682393 RepID=A0A9P9BRE1_9PEZI|nr:ricin B lectin domain-containing protein [Microdochium trichocladiopsis]KAH7027205.1 ricin B lectin domain-containing protein [Microdochium trichocladiopsis]